MTNSILVTGGAGFIGSHLVDILNSENHEVIVFDNLESQVHRDTYKAPEYLPHNVKFIQGDVRDTKILDKAMENVDIIIHLAAMVGVGQSMYEIKKYMGVNELGTAKILDILVNSEHHVKKFILASSMSIYGEGAYICKECGQFFPKSRTQDQLRKKIWGISCPRCGKLAQPIPTSENSPLNCSSIYALTKYSQEKMALLLGKTYGINTTSLRIFNTYGSRQSLYNPYTGVCSIFLTHLLNGTPPIIYEDGNQKRDFIHVNDVCQAILLSMKNKKSTNEIFNVGTGNPLSIGKIAEFLSQKINPKIEQKIINKLRPGDIRHCYADISKIKNVLDFKPIYSFEKGIKELIDWVKTQKKLPKDNTERAHEELKKQGFF